MSRLSKSYRIATYVPFGTAVIFGVVLTLTNDGSDYKSEWFVSDGFGETVFLTIILSGIISVLSLTIFLNNFKSVQNNLLFSGLAWFVLPGTLSLFVMYQELINFSVSVNYQGNRLLDGYIVLVGLLHLLCLFLSFRLYRRNGRN